MRIALSEMVVEGIKTNIPLHQDLLLDASFIRGGTSIHYLEQRMAKRKQTAVAPTADAVPGAASATCPRPKPSAGPTRCSRLARFGRCRRRATPAPADEVALLRRAGLRRRRSGRARRLTALFDAASDADGRAFASRSARIELRGARAFASSRWPTMTGCAERKASSRRCTPARRLWIVPYLVRAGRAARRSIFALDPGLAFGTGSHATTRLCLRWLAAHLARGRERARLRLRLGHPGHRGGEARRGRR